jgi:hypothetical protein
MDNSPVEHTCRDLASQGEAGRERARPGPLLLALSGADAVRRCHRGEKRGS